MLKSFECPRRSTLILISTWAFVNIPAAMGSDYFARFMVGSYLASERFADSTDGTNQNNIAMLSSRAYLHVYGIEGKKIDFFADVRDKEDFFGKLDSERLTLVPNNNFQVRQLSFNTTDASSTTFITGGRFSIPEAGGANVDGVDVSVRLKPDLFSSAFAGLDFQRPDQRYAQFNSNSYTFGTYTVYQPQFDNPWRNSFFVTGALVTQRVSGTTDRFYLYGSSVRQWDVNHLLVAILYLDFVPNPYVQTGYLSYQKPISPVLQTTATLSSIDVLEYQRRAGVLEQVPPSGYREGSLELRQKVAPFAYLEYRASYGVRTLDSETRNEYSAGPYFQRFLNQPSLFSSAQLAFRKNFTSNDVLARISGGYISREWEFDISGDLGYQKQTNSNVVHPIILEGTASRYFSRQFYGNISIQEAHNELAQILSGYFTLGYRMGVDDVAPKRALPPNNMRGRL